MSSKLICRGIFLWNIQFPIDFSVTHEDHGTNHVVNPYGSVKRFDDLSEMLNLRLVCIQIITQLKNNHFGS